MRPLLPVSLAFAGGILLGRFFDPSLPGLFTSAVALVGLFALGDFFRALIWPILILSGWAGFEVQTRPISPHDLRYLLGGETNFLVMEGVLVQTPSRIRSGSAGEETFRLVTELSVTGLQRGEEKFPAHGRVLVTGEGELGPLFFRGQRVELAGICSPPAGPVAPGLFDFGRYLRERSIFYQLRISTVDDWKTASAPTLTPPLGDRFIGWSRQVLSRGLPRDEALDLLAAMTLGWKTGLTDELSEPFMRSGTMHIFAISGLHIALIASILAAFLRVARVPRAACGALIIPALWFYTLATGLQSSAVRSSIMMTIVIAGWSLRRPSQLQNSLLGAALVILVWDPRQLFQTGFQLSFLVVLAISLLVPMFDKWFQRLLAPDPLMPSSLIPRWRQQLETPLRWLTLNFGTSLAAWLGSLPVIAYYFHLVTPCSLIANLVMVPLSAGALVCNLASLVCGDWLTPAGELFNQSAWFLMKLMVSCSQWSSEGKFAWFYSAWSELEVLAFYLGFVLIFGARILPRPWRLSLGVFAMLLLIPIVWERWSSHRSTRLTLLPFSRGSSVVFQERGSLHLIDSGDERSAERVIKPFLASRGINHIHLLLLTHGQRGQVAGLPSILSSFQLGTVRLNQPGFRRAGMVEVLSQCEENSIPADVIEPFTPLTGWELLHPPPGLASIRADDHCLVLKRTLEGIKILLLGELGTAGQSDLLNRDLLNRAGSVQADVVVSGLPATGDPLHPALMEAIDPRLVIVADSDAPGRSRLKASVRQRLKEGRVPCWFTSEEKAVWIESRNGTVEARSQSGKHFRLR